jgi:outer membrane immunogenic protein
MRRVLLGIAIASILTSGAMAADLPVKAPPMVAPVYNWTGFYIGVNGGYSWGRANTSILPLAGSPWPTVPFAPFKQNVDGGLGGGQIGYNWQFNPQWLAGVEADIQATGERSSTALATSTGRYGSDAFGLPVGPGPDFNAIANLAANLSYQLQWFATFRGRVGFLATPQTLLYGTGGLAVGQFSYSASSSLSVAVFGPGAAGTTPTGFAFTLPVGPAASSSDTRVGYTLGGGIEQKFTPNWSAKLEYLYIDFGTKTYFAGTANQADVSFHDNIFRAGVNYEFSAAGPVVAKY